MNKNGSREMLAKLTESGEFGNSGRGVPNVSRPDDEKVPTVFLRLYQTKSRSTIKMLILL